MADINRFGLDRYIPADKAREIRRRSKFGCVMPECRLGFYQYEHIDPEFKDAKEHAPESICCLCGTCHNRVTAGRLAKKTVAAAYERIQIASKEEAGRPVGPLDFSDGNAHLVIGALNYYPIVRTVLRYEGQDLIRVSPSSVDGGTGEMSAIFTDDEGKEILRLEENAWYGDLGAWDIEVVGSRLTVRKREREIALRLRLEPPGRVVVERLDMRFRDAHLMASETSYAAGRYIDGDMVAWMHADIHVQETNATGAAIEFTRPGELEKRYEAAAGRPLTADGPFAIVGGVGAFHQELRICIASGCSTALRSWTAEVMPLSEARKMVLRKAAAA